MKMIRSFEPKSLALFALLFSLIVGPVSAFDSGSTGADGPYSPVSDATIVLPANGILNYSTFNIPSGVTVTIASNVANTPAYILVQGDAVIDGVIDISGVDAGSVSSNPSGGFAGGLPTLSEGGNGQGPGGGLGGDGSGGNGGSYGSTGNPGFTFGGGSVGNPAPTYGSTSLQPLLGGSGGGASDVSGSTALPVPGNRGGGGGGALLLAVSGTLTLNGSILADGGDGADGGTGQQDNTSVAAGGGGSGGGVRLIATTLDGAGNIDIRGGARGEAQGSFRADGGKGGDGRARLEADAFSFSGIVTPNVFSASAPQPVFASNLPVLRITSVAGSTVPANPQGENDVILPSSISNPVDVIFSATDIPVGSVIELTVTPASGPSSTVTSTGLSGPPDNLTAIASVALPQGASVLTAAVSFATASISNPIYAQYTDGEKVARVEIQATMGAGSSIWITTESGRVIALPPRVANL